MPLVFHHQSHPRIFRTLTLTAPQRLKILLRMKVMKNSVLKNGSGHNVSFNRLVAHGRALFYITILSMSILQSQFISVCGQYRSQFGSPAERRYLNPTNVSNFASQITAITERPTSASEKFEKNVVYN